MFAINNWSNFEFYTKIALFCFNGTKLGFFFISINAKKYYCIFLINLKLTLIINYASKSFLYYHKNAKK